MGYQIEQDLSTKKVRKLISSYIEGDVLLGIEILKQKKSFPKNLYKLHVKNDGIFRFVKINFGKDDIIALVIGGKQYPKLLKRYFKTGKIQLL